MDKHLEFQESQNRTEETPTPGSLAIQNHQTTATVTTGVRVVVNWTTLSEEKNGRNQ